MPTNISPTVVCHLSHAPELKTTAKDRQYCKISGWTSEKVKDKDGNWNKEFSSVEAIVGGKEAEWLCKDAKKGSMVLLSGKARVRAYIAKDGTPKGVLDFIQVNTAMLLDKREEGEQAEPTPAAAPSKPAKPAAVEDGEPPF